MNNLYRGHSKDASYQVSIHLAKRLQRRRFFRNQPIRNNNCLRRRGLLAVRDEMSNLSVSVLYWKLTQSLSKSYPGVCLRTRFLLIARNCSFEAFYSFAAHGTFC
jgi:hypothetical protein